MGALVEINTDGLAKFAETVGGWLGWNARAIKLNAEAHAYETKLNAEADANAIIQKSHAENIAVLDRKRSEEQLACYIYAREERKMNNVKNVVEQAQQHFTEGEQVSREAVDTDWLNRFFTVVEDVSDAEMQQLWGRILAGEIKHPKSYSLRTMETLRNMTKEEADLFVKATSYMINCDSILVETEARLPIKEQIILSDIGLVNNEILTKTYTITAENNLSYFAIDRSFGIGIYNPHIPNIELNFAIKSLSIVGKELVKLIDYKTSDVVYEHIVEKCKQAKCEAVVKSPITGQLQSGQYTYSKKGVLLYQAEKQ
uniref:DUF2806 domain-containing protein n=1 Tax=Alistipes sp. TaxID=1872444 RepID=UPI004057B387